MDPFAPIYQRLHELGEAIRSLDTKVTLIRDAQNGDIHAVRMDVRKLELKVAPMDTKQLEASLEDARTMARSALAMATQAAAPSATTHRELWDAIEELRSQSNRPPTPHNDDSMADLRARVDALAKQIVSVDGAVEECRKFTTKHVQTLLDKQKKEYHEMHSGEVSRMDKRLNELTSSMAKLSVPVVQAAGPSPIPKMEKKLAKMQTDLDTRLRDMEVQLLATVNSTMNKSLADLGAQLAKDTNEIQEKLEKEIPGRVCRMADAKFSHHIGAVRGIAQMALAAVTSAKTRATEV